MGSPVTSAWKVGASITKSDTVILDPPVTAFMVGADGNVNITSPGNPVPQVIAVKAGAMYPIIVDRFMSTSTTATGIVSLIKA